MRQLVIGAGQIGTPLAQILAEHWETFIYDLKDSIVPKVTTAGVLHICYPWDRWFISETQRYIEQYAPRLTILHSTVVPGATESLQHHVRSEIVYSPVRGRHGQMKADLRKYTKFVAGRESGAQMAAEVLQEVGMSVRFLNPPRALELAKLLETTYSGLLIAWAQEMARYCDGAGVEYLDAARFFAEIDYLPRVVFQPGHIGGHCIMPNLELLEQQHLSPMIDAIRASNAREDDTGERLQPIPIGKVM